MPLVILCGGPCSGKSRRAEELAQLARARQGRWRSVHVVHESDYGFTDRRTVYATLHEEKKARAAVMSAVERAISPEDLVIADAMNYIKGYRYQLYCVAKNASTQHCVLFCETNADTIREWNHHESEVDGDAAAHRYPPALLDELVSRFEEPQARNRWDSPLFIIHPHDNDGRVLHELLDTLEYRQSQAPVKPNTSALATVTSHSTLMQSMDTITQQIIQSIIDGQKQGHLLNDITFNQCQSRLEVDGKVNDRQVTVGELRRWRRQFMQTNKLHQINVNLGDIFIQYLTTMIDNA